MLHGLPNCWLCHGFDGDDGESDEMHVIDHYGSHDSCAEEMMERRYSSERDGYGHDYEKRR